MADVISCVNFARDNSLDLAVRGGGHSAPGFGTWDDALVIDFSNTTGVRVDPAAATARAEAGCDVGRLQPRDACLRAGNSRRHCRLDRHRRADPRRRHRLPEPQIWAQLRQPALGRRRHGRGKVPYRQRKRERGPVLGAARRRRELRRRDVVRVPDAPRGHGPRRHHHLPHRACRDGGEVLPGPHGLRPGRVWRFPRLPPGSAGSVPARGVAWQTGVRRRRHVDR